MAEPESFQPLLTAADVRSWRAERDRVSGEIQQLESVRASLDAKLDAVALLLSPDMVELLIGRPPHRADVQGHKAPEKDIYDRAMTDLVLWFMRDERGGRSTKWVRNRMMADPRAAERIKKAPTGLSNALSRLAIKGGLSKADNDLYYLPDILRAIRSGEIEEEFEEQVQNGTPKTTFNARMHEAMASYGRPFTAGEAMAHAGKLPVLSEKLAEQPSRVYSWLSRELFKGNLMRSGEHYRYPGWNEAAESDLLNGSAASSFHSGQEGGDGHDPATT